MRTGQCLTFFSLSSIKMGEKETLETSFRLGFFSQKSGGHLVLQEKCISVGLKSFSFANYARSRVIHFAIYAFEIREFVAEQRYELHNTDQPLHFLDFRIANGIPIP